MIRGVALDMDGLLFDTEGLYWEVGDQLLMRRGHRFCKGLQVRMMGRVGVAAMQEMVDYFSLTDSAEAMLEESDELFSGMIEQGVEEMPGLSDWIDFLSQSAPALWVGDEQSKKVRGRDLPANPLAKACHSR